jgi:hypothetical protein
VPQDVGDHSRHDLGCRNFVVGRDVGLAVAGELEEGVDRRFQRAGVSLDLGEEQAALERGEEGDGEAVRIGGRRELPCLL